MPEEIVDAKVTFVMSRGEVVAFFRAIKLPEERDWTEEKPWVRYAGSPYAMAVQSGYVHCGQHGDFDIAILRECKRATPEQYGPLLREMESLGYRITPHQRGRLSLKGRK